MNDFPKVILQIHPYCNHRQKVDTCYYCQEAQKSIDSLIGLQEATKFKFTKIQVLSPNVIIIQKLDSILNEFLKTHYYPGAREFCAYLKNMFNKEN